jgi:hypothetical protein
MEACPSGHALKRSLPKVGMLKKGGLPKVGRLKNGSLPKVGKPKKENKHCFCIYKREHKERQTKLCKALLD